MSAPSDATNLVVPLWGAIVAAGGILTAVAALIAWVFATFETKTDASAKHDDTNASVTSAWTLLNKVAQDISYIRGRMEPKD